MSSSKRHIAMVLDHSFPPDIRVENEARTLVQHGFDVTVIAIGPDDRIAEEVIEGYRVHRVKLSAQVRNKMRGLAGSIPLINWVVMRSLQRVDALRPIHAIHAHDLYLFGAALNAGKRLDVPVVGDMHENWVEALRHYKWSTTVPGKWVVNLDRWQQLETDWSSRVDRLVVVIDEMVERLQGEGLKRDHITVVPNTIHLDGFDAWPSATPTDMPTGYPLVVYTGGMDRHRGLDEALDAMPGLLQSCPDAQLVLVGDGSVRGELEAQAGRLGISDHAHFLGWKAQHEVKSYMVAADIGLIPHKKTRHTDHTIPHKLFHYMRTSLPCVVSDCRPLKRIVDAEACGAVFPSGQPDALAETLVAMASDKEGMQLAGRKGREATEARWNWDATAVGLTQLYDKLLA